MGSPMQSPNPDTNIFAVIAELQAQVVAMSAVITSLEEQNKMFTLHLAKMYSAKTIEETLDIMADLGKETMKAAECTVYSVDSFDKDRIFTVDENLERRYVPLGESSMIYQAITEKQTLIDNAFSGKNEIGDGKQDWGIHNTMVVPIEDQLGDVIGVVVAKDKAGGEAEFNDSDAKQFDLQQGRLGTAFRIGLENKSLLQMATTDELTRLSNREGMNRFLETTALSRAIKHEPVSAILFDIDHFKRFNDTYGHEIGDKCLRQVADVLKENIRLSSDSGVFRWGGEEMVVLLPVGEEKAFEIAERLRHAVEETPLIVNENTKETTQITVSAGIAAFAPNEVYGLNRNNIREEFDKSCFQKADQALYQAKGNGRNRVYGSEELMRTHYSAPSPTARFQEFLKTMQLSLLKSEDGYELYDDKEKETIKHGMETPSQVIDAMQEFIEVNVLDVLRNGANDYGFDFGTRGGIAEWAEYARQTNDRPTDFSMQFAEELAIAEVLACKTDEIKLSLIAASKERDESQQDKPSQKDGGKTDKSIRQKETPVSMEEI